MAKEIERKFLVDLEQFKQVIQSTENIIDKTKICQFYLVADEHVAVRLRLEDQNRATLTIKHNPVGISVDEHEFPVTRLDYLAKLPDAVGIEIKKTRYRIPYDGRTWEVDVFYGDLHGLFVAEIECEDAATITNFPPWVAVEVTHDRRYKNAVLAIEGYTI